MNDELIDFPNREEKDNLMVATAVELAYRAHSGQKRKYTGEDYFIHPCRVAKRVAELTGAQILIAAAYLHDVLEDTSIIWKEICDLVDVEVADLVLELTNPSKNMKLPRQERKMIDRQHLATASLSAKLIKTIDRIDNLKDMKNAPDDFKKLYADESRLLMTALGLEKDTPLHKEFLEAIENLG